MSRQDVGPVSGWILDRGKDRRDWGPKERRDHERVLDRMIELHSRWPWLRKAPLLVRWAVTWGSFWVEALKYRLVGDGEEHEEDEG